VPGGESKTALVLAAGSVVVLGCLLYAFGSAVGSVKRTDFVVFYAAVHMVTVGHGALIYHLPALARAEVAVARPYHITGGLLPFLNPPFLALLLAPLGLLPYTGAYLTLLGINAVICAMVVVRLMPPAAGRLVTVAAVLAALSSFPVFIALVQGQTSLLVLAALTGAVTCLRSDRDIPAGACLALTLIKPQFALPLLLVLITQRRWKALSAFAGSAAAIAALSLVLVGPGGLADWLHVLLTSGGWGVNRGFAPQANFGLPSLIGRLDGHGPLVEVLSAVSVLVPALLLVRMTRRSAPSSRRLWAAATLTGILISPHLLVHDLTIAILPLGLLAGELPRSRVLVFLAAAYLVVLIGPPSSQVLPVQIPTVLLTILTVWVMLVSSERSLPWERAAHLPNVLGPATAVHG